MFYRMKWDDQTRFEPLKSGELLVLDIDGRRISGMYDGVSRLCVGDISVELDEYAIDGESIEYVLNVRKRATYGFAHGYERVYWVNGVMSRRIVERVQVKVPYELGIGDEIYGITKELDEDGEYITADLEIIRLTGAYVLCENSGTPVIFDLTRPCKRNTISYYASQCGKYEWFTRYQLESEL
ncbi:hypothetical protein MYOV011v1_p0405 [Vibrio phage 6E35.1a]|nr:hypothetical protein MYOV011v1_p0405 [Vibrio phage 6E35.1a]